MATAFEIGYRLGLTKQAGAVDISKEFKPIVPSPKVKQTPAPEQKAKPKQVVDVDLDKYRADVAKSRKQYEASGPSKEQRRQINEVADKGGSRDIARIQSELGIIR